LRAESPFKEKRERGACSQNKQTNKQQDFFPQKESAPDTQHTHPALSLARFRERKMMDDRRSARALFASFLSLSLLCVYFSLFSLSVSSR
jgi:hypothetical protein